jgi:hypothetical protein
MSDYKLYTVTVGFDLVVAAKKHLNPRAAVEDALRINIIDIVSNQLNEDDTITYHQVDDAFDLPYGWKDHMLPYHNLTEDMDSKLTIRDILGSNKKPKKPLYRIEPLEKSEKQIDNEKQIGELLSRIEALEEALKSRTDNV